MIFIEKIVRINLCGLLQDCVRVFSVLIFFSLLGCYAYAQQPNSLFGRGQGTTYSIKYYGDDIVSKQEVDSILHVIDCSMSLYDPSSLICKFNDSNTSQVVMDEHMKNVVKASIRTFKETNGFFDMTVHPLVKLWGFSAHGAQAIPSQRDVDSVRSLIGTKKLRVKGNVLIKDNPRIAIDLNGIAQGYTVDVLAEYFEARGVTDYLIELGGEIRSRGKKPTGPFVVEIQRPYSSKNAKQLRVRLNNNAVTSSASYEQQHKVGDKTVSHHMNPITGTPLESSIVSVTVIAKTAMRADALDNYFMSLTPVEAVKYADKKKDIAVYVIYFEAASYKELHSKNFNKFFY